jgi:hypothetical protein
MDTPRPITAGFLHELAGDDCIQLGIYASGEPILARVTGDGCEVLEISEEGELVRYRGLEGFLLHQKLRRADGDFELDAWMK